MSSIEWTDATWNPVVGCTPVSPGCLNCYAAALAPRLGAMGQEQYVGLTVSRSKGGGARDEPWRRTFNGTVRCLEERLDVPLHWRKPRRVFVNSMSDLFHEKVPDAFIDRVFAVMALCPQHTFQVLTKRPERMAEYMAGRDGLRGSKAPRWACVAYHADEMATTVDGRRLSDIEVRPETWPLPNVWLGASVEDQARADERIPHLLRTPAAVRFLSCEPLLGPVDLGKAGWKYGSTDFAGLQWVIVGGESGHNARKCSTGSVRWIVHQCQAAGVPCFVKQLGARPSPVKCDATAAELEAGLLNLKDRKGGDPSEWPEDLRVRQWPAGVAL